MTTLIQPDEFADKMAAGPWKHPSHPAYATLLYYSAVRKMEALRTLKSQFNVTPQTLFWDVGPRLKKLRRFDKDGKPLSDPEYLAKVKKNIRRITTPPLPLPTKAPYMDVLINQIEATPDGERVFKFCPATAYNAISRVFTYPHHFRLSRITWFFMPHPEVGRPRGFSIPEVRTYTGLTLRSIDHYIGLADIKDMGRSMYEAQLKGGE